MANLGMVMQALLRAPVKNSVWERGLTQAGYWKSCTPIPPFRTPFGNELVFLYFKCGLFFQTNTTRERVFPFRSVLNVSATENAERGSLEEVFISFPVENMVDKN